MSGDPKNGVVFLNLAQDTGKQYATTTVNGVATAWAELTQDSIQASGVLIAPDEVLVAAHSVVGNDGNLRSLGTVQAGYDGGASPLGTQKVDAIHVLPRGEYTSTPGMSADYAVVHLSSPVVGGTIFDLGTLLGGGDANVSGYPAGASGHYATQSEHVTRVNNANLLTGPALTGGGDPHGGSGGPLWTMQNGTPTVVGDVSGGDSTNGSVGYFKALTDADIGQIHAWISGDHGGGLGDSIMALGNAIGGDAATHPRQAGMMSDAAAALQSASGASDWMGAAAQGIDEIMGASGTPNRSAAFLAGVIAAEQGVGGSMGDVIGWVGDNVGYGQFKNAIVAGYHEGAKYL